MDLKELEYKKVLKDVKYWKEEYELKKSIFESIENLFNKEVSSFLEKNPSLKEKWNYYMDKKIQEIENIVKKNIQDDIKKLSELELDSDINSDSESDDIKVEKNKDLKKIYREIAKLSHPDKISEDDLEKNRKIEIYKKATEYYDSDNISELIYLANELNIKYDYTNIEIDIFKKDIESFKQQSMSFENTLYWKWYYDNKNESLISQYLSQFGI